MSINLVLELTEKFNLPMALTPSLPSSNEIDFRVDRLYDEMREMTEALDEQDLIAVFDALIDLVYVAYGTALRFGITPEMWAEGFQVVHNANMKKVKVASELDSRFNNKHDLKKPEGWVPPEEALQKILGV